MYLSRKLIPQLMEMMKCKLLSQTLTYLGLESSIKYLGENQIETSTLTYTHIHTDTHIHAHIAQTDTHLRTRRRASS